MQQCQPRWCGWCWPAGAQPTRDGLGRRPCDGASVSRPVPGHLEVIKLTHQLRQQRAERTALGDRIPPAALADPPPGAAFARGDISPPANLERAPAEHAPYRGNRFMRLQAFDWLIEDTHGEV